VTRRARVLQVAVTDARGKAVAAPWRAHVAGLAGWLARVAPAGTRGVVSVAVVGDARMRSLNRRHLGRDYATDVLAFAGGARATGPFLGDIVIATGVARRQARRAGHAERVEFRVLALHGLLHLLGYDHHVDDGAMERLEVRLRRKGGLREGLIERAGQS
jgi:probable rRNA maturation factor